MIEPLERRRLLSHWLYVTGRTFGHDASAETLELLNKSRVVFANDTFAGGSTTVRLNRCNRIAFEHCTFTGGLGTPDPDGADLQTIDCGDILVDRCTFKATAFSSDLISDYGDAPHPGTVIVTRSRFYGAGTCDFSTSVCEDGPHPTDLILSGDTIRDARCGLTVAAGRCVARGMIFAKCETPIYVAELYGMPAVLA